MGCAIAGGDLPSAILGEGENESAMQRMREEDGGVPREMRGIRGIQGGRGAGPGEADRKPGIRMD